MTLSKLLERKVVLENQIRDIEAKIIKETDPIREKRLFNMINRRRASLKRIDKLLVE